MLFKILIEKLIKKKIDMQYALLEIKLKSYQFKAFKIEAYKYI